MNDSSYQKAFDQIRDIVKHRRGALYHQQAIQEALITGLDFMKIPSTTALVAALKSKDKVKIKAAADSLQIAADKYFSAVPFPEVERLVGKKMLQTYMKYIPPNNASVSSRLSTGGSRVTVMLSLTLVSNIPSLAARKTLPSSSASPAV